MKHSIKTGLSFGLTSGIITTLGLIVGLNAGTHSKIAVVGGILTIAIADAFSDALGVHVSQESQGKISKKSVWEATFATLLAKIFFASTFILPVLLFELGQAILLSVIWGLLVLSIFNYFLAKQKNENPWELVAEHLVIALIVIVITRLVGDWVAVVFK